MLKTKPLCFAFLMLLSIIVFFRPSMAGNDHAHQKPLKSSIELEYPPFAIVKNDGSADGFSVDLLKAVTQAVDLDIAFSIGPWDTIKQELINGKIDVLPLVSYSAHRDRFLDFSAPYIRTHDTIFVRRGDKSIQSKADLKDKEVLVVRGGMSHEYALEHELASKLVLTPSCEKALRLLSSGHHDAIIIQKLVGHHLIRKLGITNLVNVDTIQEPNIKSDSSLLEGFEQKFCIAVPQGERELLSLLNEGLAIVVADGTYDKLYKKWFELVLPLPSANLKKSLYVLLLALLPLGAIVVLLCVVYLQRDVARKTEKLKDEIKVRACIEEALLRSEKKWRNIFISIPQIGVGMDPQGRILFANNFFLKLTGWKEEEVLYQDWFEMFIPQKISDHIREVFTTTVSQPNADGASSYVNEILTRSGEIRVIEWSNVLSLNSQGNVVDITCLGIDITERETAAKALQQSEQKYHSFFDISADATILFTENGDIIESNKAFLELMGFESVHRMKKYNVADFCVDSGDRAAWISEINSKGFLTDFETTLKRIDGTAIEINASAIIYKSDQGNYIVSTIRDMTERKRTEAALTESEEKFRQLLENINEIFWIRDAQTNELLYISPNFENVWGVSIQSIIESPERLLDTVYLADRDSVSSIFSNQEEYGPFEHEYRIVKPDGTVRWIHCKNFPILDESGAICRRAGVSEDITDKKNMEIELIQKRKMEAIGTLAGGIAHDFNNVLSSIIGFTELALDDVKAGSTLEDNLQEVFSAGKRAKELVWQILTFARQTDEHVRPVQVDTIVKEVLKFIRSSIPATIEIRRKIDSNAHIMGNPTQVHQIVMNLITNAAQAMEATGGVLEVSLKNVSINEGIKAFKGGATPGDYVEIRISDTGVGIAPDVIGSIFEPYFTTKRPGEGTGMGLAVVHGIADNLGGKITVESQLGKGTDFKVFLPITDKTSIHCAYAPDKLPSGGESILFVDDEVPIVKIGNQVLDQLGYTVTTQTSSVEALELFRSTPDKFDLVITDMTMPGMTGDVLAAELMTIRHDIPIILCTGYSRNISSESAAHIGIKAFAYKPFVKADLARTIRRVLDEPKGQVCQQISQEITHDAMMPVK